jgi:hypothetical protein
MPLDLIVLLIAPHSAFLLPTLGAAFQVILPHPCLNHVLSLLRPVVLRRSSTGYGRLGRTWCRVGDKTKSTAKEQERERSGLWCCWSNGYVSGGAVEGVDSTRRSRRRSNPTISISLRSISVRGRWAQNRRTRDRIAGDIRWRWAGKGVEVIRVTLDVGSEGITVSCVEIKGIVGEGSVRRVELLGEVGNREGSSVRIIAPELGSREGRSIYCGLDVLV